LVLAAPAGTLLNAVELQALSRIGDGRMSWCSSWEVTLYTNAANMLPLPGGAITKLAGLKAHGVNYRTGTLLLVLSTAAWGCTSFLLAGAALLSLGQSQLATIFLLCGGTLFGLFGLISLRFRWSRWTAALVAVRIVYFLVEAFRYMLAILSIGGSATLLQSSIFVIATFIGAAAVIAPQGLGVSEATAAALATAIGISAAVGFLAAVVIRVSRYVGLAVIAGVSLLLSRASRAAGTTYSGSA
jgi:hypothetical protein